jgi:2-hydroxy-6-oxonona-2,4-dienedioate hydrolase
MQPYKSMWSDLIGLPFSQGFIDAGGLRTRYLSSGSPDQPFLLFLHGVGGHAEAYVRNLAAHGAHFRTMAIDLFGHGFTDKPPIDGEIPVYIEQLKNLLDTLGVKQCFLSGESLGGWVACRFALAYPDRVARLVLNTPGGSHSNPETLGRLRSLTMAAAEDPSWERVKARLEFLMKDKSKVTDDLIATRQRIYSQPNMIEAFRRITVLMEPETRKRNLLTEEQFQAVRTPTLVLWTSDDPMADVNEGRRIARLIPGSTFVVMPDCGHWPQFEDPERFNRIHIAFLKGEPVPECVESI